MKRGFTLIEMVVVLMVIALATHLAMRELSHIRDAKMEQSADKQLETIRAAAIEFLGDMGRLVCATNGNLSELWNIPQETLPFAIRPATAENLFPGAPADLVDPDVFVPTGWKGPYLRLPIGKKRLLDPWGNPIETEDSAMLSRIGLTNGIHACSVSHYGATAQEKAKRSLPLLPERGAESTLHIKAISASGTSVTNEITYKWYGPADGTITGAVARAGTGKYAVFHGLTPGRRIVYDSLSGTSREVNIEPGDTNLIEIKTP